MIKHNKVLLDQNILKSSYNFIKDGNLATSKYVKKLENYFEKSYYKKGYAVATSSGTSALYIAIKSLIKKKRTRILVPTYSCSALLNAIYMANATPVVADINEKNFVIDTKKIYQNIDIIIAVNIFGSDPDIKTLKKKYPNSKIIFDACHSIGRKVNKNDQYFLADIIIHSFYATKIITCGHGGLIWSKNKNSIDFCKDFINFDLRKKYKKRFNFLITDFQVSLLFEQLKNLEKIRRFRNNTFKKYKSAVKGKIKIFSNFDLRNDIVYRAVLIFNSFKEKQTFKNKLAKNGVESITPIENFELLHNYKNLHKKNFSISESISKRTLSLPLYLSLKKYEINKICKLLNSY